VCEAAGFKKQRRAEHWRCRRPVRRGSHDDSTLLADGQWHLRTSALHFVTRAASHDESPRHARGNSDALHTQTRRPIIPHVKNFRIVILILLAFLLPVRGAFAAACPGGGQSGTAVLGVEQAVAGMHADHGMHDEQATGHPPACEGCAGTCCMTPLAFAPPSVQATVLTTSVLFPVLAVPIPDFYSGGQDRPPRTV